MLSIDARVAAESDGLHVRVDGIGKVLTCRIDGHPAHLFATLRRGGTVVSLVRALTPLLVRSGLRIDVLVGSVRIASAGNGVRQNALARLLRLPSVHLGA